MIDIEFPSGVKLCLTVRYPNEGPPALKINTDEPDDENEWVPADLKDLLTSELADCQHGDGTYDHEALDMLDAIIRMASELKDTVLLGPSNQTP